MTLADRNADPGTAAPKAPHIAGIALTNVRISGKTNWLFMQVLDAAGRIGVGEATLLREELAVTAELARIAPSMLGLPADPRKIQPAPLAGQARARGAVVSAIDQALWDLTGQREHLGIARLLGSPASEVELYANVNRGIATRDPAGFAAAARNARIAGFRTVKIAPFDEIDAHGRWGPASAPTGVTLRLGIDRIAAVRDAIGVDSELMIDCHWRMDEPWATRVIDAVAAFGLYWIECPIPEHEAMVPALKRLRERANRHGMRLAGGENGVGREAFDPFLHQGAYDVLMPDIKYVGGFAEMHAVADMAARHNVAIAPHNPSGPVAHAASLHACAGLAGFTRLEMQFNESPLFDALVHPALARPVAGRATLPDLPGLGIALAPNVAGELEVARESWGAAIPQRVAAGSTRP